MKAERKRSNNNGRNEFTESKAKQNKNKKKKRKMTKRNETKKKKEATRHSSHLKMSIDYMKVSHGNRGIGIDKVWKIGMKYGEAK